jgi:hypothetical protein
MRPADFFVEDEVSVVEDDPFFVPFETPSRHVNEDLLEDLRRKPLTETSDIGVAVPPCEVHS